MALAVGPASKVFVSDRVVQLVSVAASGGTPPYAYQWHKSVVSGFTPGPSNAITGATSLSLNDSAVLPGTTYYYSVTVTDAVPNTATSAQLTVLTSQPTLSPNQFALAPFLGQLDLKFNSDTISVEYDINLGVGGIYAGQLLKFTQTTMGVPKVVPIAADTDEVAGALVYDIKTQLYVPGTRMEMSMSQNVQYMYATGAIARGQQVVPDITTVGGVQAAVPSSGNNIIGWAVDVALVPGLIRIKLSSPSYSFA